MSHARKFKQYRQFARYSFGTRRHSDTMGYCISCTSRLHGRQRKFCSLRCKNAQTNSQFQSYGAQQKRGRKRKIALVRLHGSKCEQCGYKRNFSAMEFHHVIPTNKCFNLDLRSLSNRRWERVLVEAQKCRLLCSNCHKEVHNPDCLMPD